MLDPAFSNGNWWVDVLRVIVLFSFAASLLLLPKALNIVERPGRVRWLAAALSLLLVSASSRTGQHFGEAMVWDRTPMLLGAGICLLVYLYLRFFPLSDLPRGVNQGEPPHPWAELR